MKVSQEIPTPECDQLHRLFHSVRCTTLVLLNYKKCNTQNILELYPNQNQLFLLSINAPYLPDWCPVQMWKCKVNMWTVPSSLGSGLVCTLVYFHFMRDIFTVGAEYVLPCEAGGFVRSRENPFCQASSYSLVSAPPISPLGGTLLAATGLVLGVTTIRSIHGGDLSLTISWDSWIFKCRYCDSISYIRDSTAVFSL